MNAKVGRNQGANATFSKESRSIESERAALTGRRLEPVDRLDVANRVEDWLAKGELSKAMAMIDRIAADDLDVHCPVTSEAPQRNGYSTLYAMVMRRLLSSRLDQSLDSALQGGSARSVDEAGLYIHHLTELGCSLNASQRDRAVALADGLYSQERGRDEPAMRCRSLIGLAFELASNDELQLSNPFVQAALRKAYDTGKEYLRVMLHRGMQDRMRSSSHG